MFVLWQSGIDVVRPFPFFWLPIEYAPRQCDVLGGGCIGISQYDM